MLIDTISSDMTASLKAGNHVRVDTLRFLIAAVRNMAIAKYGAAGDTSLTDTDVLDVIKKQVKTHKESIDAFTKAGRAELADKEQKELDVLLEFAPKELSDEELLVILAPLKDVNEPNMGKLMGQAMKLVAGRADGGRVSSLLKQIIK